MLICLALNILKHVIIITFLGNEYKIPGNNGAYFNSMFSRPADVDLWSGGVSERPLPGSMLGPTFACIIATQFSYSRRGDRFWYELPNQPSSFTLGKKPFQSRNSNKLEFMGTAWNEKDR